MPRLIELSETDTTALGQRIVDLWTDDNQDREQWLADLPMWRKMYQGRIEAKDTPWKGASNLHVPLVATHVDAIHPRVMAALFQPEPICSFKPQEPSDEAKARKRETFLDWAVREDVPLFAAADRFVLDTLIDGLKIVKLTWELTCRNVRDKHTFPIDLDPATCIQAVMQAEGAYIEALKRVNDAAYTGIVKGREVTVEVAREAGHLCVYTEREEVVRDAPKITLIDPEDFCVESDADYDLQRTDHALHRYWMTANQIRQAARKGQFRELSPTERDDLDRLAGTNLDAKDNTTDVKTRREEITGATVINRQSEPDRVELIDAYLGADINDDGEDEQIIATVVREQPDLVLRIVRLEDMFRHGMRPFVAFYYAPVANSFWAIGVPQILEGIQTEIDVIHNQRVDAGTISNTPWGWYVPAAGFNPEKIPLVPGYLLPVDDINRVKMHQPSNFTAWGFQEEAGLLAMAERRTKVNDLTLGRVGDVQGAARTASGVQALSAQQATGFDITIRRFQDGFKQLLQQLLGLYAQYMPPGKQVRILGAFKDPDQLISRDDLRGQMDLRFTGNSLNTDREMERQTSTFLAQGPMNPQVMSFLLQLGVTSPPGIAEWYRHLLSVFDVPRLERILKIPETPVLNSVEDIVNRCLSGERIAVQPGENHQAVMQAILALLGGPDAVGFPPEILVVLQDQLQKRQVQAQQDAMIQAIQQAMLQPVAPAGAVPPPQTILSGQGTQVPPPGIQRSPVYAR